MNHHAVNTVSEKVRSYCNGKVVRLVLVGLSVTSVGCDKFSQNMVRDQRDGLIEGVGKAKTVEVVTDPSSGVISAKMSANSPFTQEIRAASDGALKGTILSFPPGTLRMDTEIAVEESVALASVSLGATLGIDGSLTKSSTAIAVLPQAATDPAQPFTVAISLSNNGNLRLATENLVILYKVRIFAENRTVAGVIPTSAITLEGNVVKFSAQYFGAFQAAYSSVPVTEERKVEVSTPIQAKREVANLPPVAISGRSTFVVRSGDTVQLTGQNFRPTMTLALGTSAVKDAKVLSDTSASFVVPQTSLSGPMPLTVDQDGTTQAVALFYSAAPLSYPVSTLSPSEVCQGTVYYDGSGKQVSGTKPCVVEACTATKSVTCVANDNFPAIDRASLPVDKIRVGTTIAARGGTLANCSEAGEGCVVVAPFKAADVTGLGPKIVSGYTVAGVGGSVNSESHVSCTAENTLGCITTATFPPVDTAGLANKILSPLTVAGVMGSVTLPPEADVRTGVTYGVGGTGLLGSYSGGGGGGPTNCNGTTHTNCLATTSFPSVYPAQILPNLRFGTTIDGIGGSIEDCSANLDVGCYAGGTFKAVDSSALATSAWNIRAGTSIAGVPGQLKTNCRNTVNSAYYNYDGTVASLPSSTDITGTLLDFWDTLDDYQGWSNNKVTGWSADTLCDSSVWEDRTTTDGGTNFTTCVSTPTNCIYKDKITNLEVTRIVSNNNLTWPAAIQECALTPYGGYSAGAWRLPTQKELMALYEHGILSQASNDFIDVDSMRQGSLWSATSDAVTPDNAWSVVIGTGATSKQDKDTTLKVICVK
jgi:hypothetical protein